MKKQVHEVVGNVQIVEIPFEVSVPVYKKKEMPEYVLVKEEITYKVPKVQYEDKTYEKPVLKEKEYIIPIYVEKEYEIPIYKEKEYEIPIHKEKIYDIPVVNWIHKEQVKVIEKPYEVKVPKLVQEDVKVTNAIIEDRNVIHANIKHVTVEALHPRYICPKCKKEEVNP